MKRRGKKCPGANGSDAPAARRNSWALIVVTIAITATLALGTLDAEAQTVRGRIVFQNKYPVNGAAVRVMHPRMGPSGFAYTGNDGMYYLNGIPPGDYELQIFFNGGIVGARPIRVLPQPLIDIPPYFLRF